MEPINLKQRILSRAGIVSLIILTVFLFVAWIFSPDKPFSKVGAWYSIAPPLIAVVLAYLTRKLLISLFIGLFIGGLLTQIPTKTGEHFNLLKGIGQSVIYTGEALIDPWNLKVLAFVVLVLAMICVVIAAGGLEAIIDRLQSRIKDARSSKLMTYILGLLVFIDDYANTMIVGSSMRPVSDKHRISREKLAFIIDATSAPVAGLAIISTWIGFEVGLFGKVSSSLSMGHNGYDMFFDALPFRFYCILMLIFVLINILKEKDYGPMLHAEQRAIRGEPIPPSNEEFAESYFKLTTRIKKSKPGLLTALFPFATLIICLLGGLWWQGGGMAHLEKSILSVFSPFTWREVISHSKDTTLVLMLAAAFSLIMAIDQARRAGLGWPAISSAIRTALKSSMFPIALLILAWSLKSVSDDLNTGEFLVATIGQGVDPWLFPVLLFLVAALTSFGTGTSWGTMAILIPTAIPVAWQLDGQSYGLITIISLGAVLDGSIFGDHCSPISDTTIMTSIASGCDHIRHVQTQIPYALTVGLIALAFGYIPAAFDISAWLSIAAGASMIYAIIHFAGKAAK